MEFPNDYRRRIRGVGEYGRLRTILHKVRFLIDNGDGLNDRQKKALIAIHRYLREVYNDL